MQGEYISGYSPWGEQAAIAEYIPQLAGLKAVYWDIII
jgi:hypothetical protein